MTNVQLEEGTILHNLEVLMGMAASHSTDWSVLANSTSASGTAAPGFPMNVLDDVLKSRREVDKIIVLSDDGEPSAQLLAFADLYRWQTNPDLLLVHVDLSGAKAGVQPTPIGADTGKASDLNVQIAGFSDAILRYIADRGDGADQVTTIDTINVGYGISQAAHGQAGGSSPSSGSDAATRTFSTASAVSAYDIGRADATESSQVQSRSIKVFISSTFRDMHGERDILTRYVHTLPFVHGMPVFFYRLLFVDRVMYVDRVTLWREWICIAVG